MTVKKAKNTKFFCRDCYMVFEILSEFDGRELRHKYCPGCGDCVAVEPYNEPGESENKFWEPEEIELLDKYIAKEMHIYKLKILTGRSENSIYSKVKRRLEEKGMPKQRKPKPWTAEHIELVDKLIRKEITIGLVMEITEREYRSIENKKYSRIKELGIKNANRRFNAWKIEELLLADRCIAGEMTIRELATKLDRNLKTVRNFIGQRKKNKIKNG